MEEVPVDINSMQKYQEVVENVFHKLQDSTVTDRHFVEVLDAVSKTKDLAVVTGRTGGLVWAQVVLRVKPKSVKMPVAKSLPEERCVFHTSEELNIQVSKIVHPRVPSQE